MKSIIQPDTKECFVTGQLSGLHKHHCVYGIANRKQSEKYGLWVWLSADLHNVGKHSVHNNPNGELDLLLKRTAQLAFEYVHGSRADFVKIFGRNYLDEGGAE